MKYRILTIGVMVCLVSIALSIFFHIKEYMSYNNLYKIYSTNFSILEDEILTINNGTLDLLEKVNENQIIDISDASTIINNLNLLDILQKNYSIMIQEYYTNIGSDFKNINNGHLDYSNGITFYHDISSYIDALHIEQTSAINNFILSENDIKKGRTVISILNSVSELYSPFQEERFFKLSERDKMRQRVIIQIDLSQKLIEINQKALDLLK